jgi:hypothetical protein
MPTEHQTESLTSQAPLPRSTGTEHAYNLLIHIMVKKDNIAEDIAVLLKDHMKGCGRVDLVEINCNYNLYQKGDRISIGFSEVGGSEDAMMYSMKASGHRMVAGENVLGTSTTLKLVPEDTLSRQLQPPPADLPMMKLHLAKKGTLDCMLIFKLKVHGVRAFYQTLN